MRSCGVQTFVEEELGASNVTAIRCLNHQITHMSMIQTCEESSTGPLPNKNENDGAENSRPKALSLEVLGGVRTTVAGAYVERHRRFLVMYQDNAS